MNIKKVGKICGDQDGAIFGNELFRFGTFGECSVYNLDDLKADEPTELVPVSSFTLDRADVIAPHSNAVTFGADFFDPTDKYPLLYTNVYNNYRNCDNKLLGVCCVYRLKRTENHFESILVQLIEIDFCDDAEHWRAYPDCHGDRPYGNFIVDRERRRYIAFVMKNEEQGTPYFEFDIPSLDSGEIDAELGVRRVKLSISHVQESFWCPYHRFMQGAAVHGGMIYSTEGFSNDEINRPAIRIISTAQKRQERYIDLMALGYLEEPEMIDFCGDDCYYSDAHGNLYKIEF